MVALATAFVRLRPEVNRAEFQAAGKRIGDTTGDAAGKSMGARIMAEAQSGLRKTERQSRASGERAGAAFGAGLGQKLNRQLRDLNLPELNLKADAASANRSITVTQEHLRSLAKNADNIQLRLDASNALRDINRLEKQVGAMSTETERSGRRMSSASDSTSAFGKAIALTAARATLLGGSVAAAVPGIIHLTAAVLPAAGALTGLPIALAGFQAVKGTFLTAVAGVGDAIKKGLTGTSQEAEKALAELPPAAQNFARSIIDLKEPIDALRASVAQRFFTPLQDEIRPLAQLYLPMLRTEMSNLAEPLGGLGEQIARTARRAEVFTAVRDVFQSSQAAAVNLRGAIDPLGRALAAVLSSTAGLLPGMAQGFTSLATRVAGFVTEAAKSGQLVRLWQNAMTTLRDLGGIVGNVGSILVSVFRAATANGNSLLANFRALTGEAATFLRTAQGADALRTVFATLARLGDALRTSLGAVLPQIAESIGILGPVIAGLATQASRFVVALAPLLPSVAQLAAAVGTALIPVLSALAGFIEHNKGLVTTLATAFLAYRGAVLVAGAATKAWGVIQGAIVFTRLIGQVRSLGDAWRIMGITTQESGTRVAAARAELDKVGPAADRSSSKLGKVGKAMGVVGAAIGGLQIASAALGSSVNPQLDAMAVGLQQFAQRGRAAGEAARVFGDNGVFLDQALHDLGRTDAWSSFIRGAGSMVEGLTGIGAAYDKSLQHSRERLAGLSQELANMVQAGQGQQAAAIFQQVARRAAEQGVSVARLKQIMPEYAAALEQTGGSAKKAAAGIDVSTTANKYAKAATDAAAAAARGQRSALIALSNAVQAEFDPVMGLIQAQKDFKKAQDAAAAAVKQHGKNSREARAASLDLASAAINLTGKAGALGDKFDGKVSPSMRRVFQNAGLTKDQIKNVERSFADARKAGDKFAKNYRASVGITNNKAVSDRLWALGEIQRGLKAGNLSATRNSYLHSVAGGRLAEGGTVPGWSPNKKADNIPAYLTAGEFVQPVSTVDYYGTGFMKAIQKKAIPREIAAQIAAYANGGPVRRYAAGGTVMIPYPVNAGVTHVPSVKEIEASVAPAVPTGGGQTWRWIVKAARALVGAVRVISTVRPGARTLSGNRSYHAVGRAVDFAPSMQLARKWNVTYGRRTQEEITPWRQYDLWHGRPHHYSAALHAQHSGGNAHVHIAVAGGGLITPGGKGLPLKLFDTGGAWPSGTLGANLSGRTEYVSTERDGRTVEFHAHFHGPVASERAAEDMVYGAWKRLRRDRKIT